MKHPLFFKLLFLLASCGYAQSTYINPVYKADFPDPTVIRGHDGKFYVYGTNTDVAGGFYHIQVATSSDLIHWEIIGDALPTKPSWADKDFWAPHVLYDKEGWPFIETNSPGIKPLGIPSIKKNNLK